MHLNLILEELRLLDRVVRPNDLYLIDHRALRAALTARRDLQQILVLLRPSLFLNSTRLHDVTPCHRGSSDSDRRILPIVCLIGSIIEHER